MSYSPWCFHELHYPLIPLIPEPIFFPRICGLSAKLLGQTADTQHPAVLSYFSLKEKAVHTGRAPTDLRDTHCEGLEKPRCVTQSINFIVFMLSANFAAELSSQDQTPEGCIPQRQKKAHLVFAPQIRTQLVYFPVTLISPVPHDCLSSGVGLIFKYISQSQNSHWAS